MVQAPEQAAAASVDTAALETLAALAGRETAPLILRLPPEWELSDEAFLELCQLNELWHIETTAEGALSIVVGKGWGTSRIGIIIATSLEMWSQAGGGGETGGASGAIRLTERMLKIPEVSWVSDERVRQGRQECEGVVMGACPDLIVEVRPASDQLRIQQENMELWLAYGARLGWLVVPPSRSVSVYRPQADVEVLARPASLSGEDVCVGLVVAMERVWARLDEVLGAGE